MVLLTLILADFGKFNPNALDSADEPKTES